MKTDRRQELRTNELSQQLEQVSLYVKKNVALLTTIIVAAAVIVGGFFWYVHHREQKRLAAWASLNKAAEGVEAGSSPFSVFESVIQQDLSPGLTSEALLRMGQTAMDKYTEPAAPAADPTTGVPAGNPAEWAAKAKEAYTQIVTRYPDDVTASGSAMIALGVLCEDRKELDQARRWYKKITEDTRFASTSFTFQAAYRLAHLDRWASPVNFPPPLHTVPEPPSSMGSTLTPEMTRILSTLDPASPRPGPPTGPPSPISPPSPIGPGAPPTGPSGAAPPAAVPPKLPGGQSPQPGPGATPPAPAGEGAAPPPAGNPPATGEPVTPPAAPATPPAVPATPTAENPPAQPVNPPPPAESPPPSNG